MMRSVCLIMLPALLFVAGIASPAAADPKFYTEFKKLYLDKHPDKKFVAEVHKGTNRCLVCHQGKKSRKNHNAFGKPLVELLDRKTDLKDVAKITAAIEKVAAMKVDPDNEKSETYLDRIKASKWPGGEFEYLQKEPADLTAGK
jgi:cytochrome c2